MYSSINVIPEYIKRLRTVMNSERTSCWDAGHVVIELTRVGVCRGDGVDDVSSGGGNGRNPSRGCNTQVSVYSLQ